MIKKCPVCLRSFEGRRDKKCCSEKCSRRLRRTPPKSELLKSSYDDAMSAIRLISMYADDYELKARALNMLRSLIRLAATELPEYLRVPLGKEILESVDSRIYLEYVGHRSVQDETNI